MGNYVDDDAGLDSKIITCWCGARGTYEELFNDEVFDDTCGGTRSLDCLCGGDFCVCHHHGEIECPGCEDCEGDDDDWDGMDDYYYDSDDDDYGDDEQ